VSARLPEELAEVLSPEPRVGGNGSAPPGRVVGGYLYTDEDGAPLFVVARLEPKSFRQGRVIGDRVDWQLGDTRRVLYRLPELLAHIEANEREPIFVVEGEKDADAIIAAGGIATCNPMGAGKWLDDYAETLRGARRVLVVVDQDEQRGDDGLTIGERHARDIRESLAAVGVETALVRAAVGKDAADHLAAGHSLAELQPFELPAAPGEAAAGLHRSVTVEEFAAGDVKIAAPLIGGADTRLLPAASTICIYGEGGSGKTTLEIDLSFHLAAGVDWLGFEIAEPVRVMLLENEGPIDEYRLKIRRKLASWGARASPAAY
jgi:AAA domain